MGIGSGLIAAGLRSPLRRLLDGSFDLVRYQGRRSGETFTTPTQYAVHGDGIVIFVGRSERKTWWRNFRGGNDLEVWLDGRWVPMVGELVVGAENQEAIAPLLASYLRRYPKVARHLPEGATEERAAVVVWCRPARASDRRGSRSSRASWRAATAGIIPTLRPNARRRIRRSY